MNIFEEYLNKITDLIGKNQKLLQLNSLKYYIKIGSQLYHH